MNVPIWNGQVLLMEPSCFNLRFLTVGGMGFIPESLLLMNNTMNLADQYGSIDEGCTHQRSWGRVGDVAGTVMRKTQVAVQSRGPGGNLPPAGQPRHMYACVAVCLHMQTNCLLYLIPTPIHR